MGVGEVGWWFAAGNVAFFQPAKFGRGYLA